MYPHVPVWGSIRGDRGGWLVLSIHDARNARNVPTVLTVMARSIDKFGATTRRLGLGCGLERAGAGQGSGEWEL